MKKSHMVLLVITAVMALFSVYSLAAINKVYSINYQWYSQYNNKFTSEFRQTNRDSWNLRLYPEDLKFQIVNDKDDLNDIKEGHSITKSVVRSTDFSKYILIYCTLGEAFSPEYRIKVASIAQRGNVVEVKLSVNSPDRLNSSINANEVVYYPEDVVKVSRNMFPTKGKLYFIFKNQKGIQIGDNYCSI
jgi:hypothetical protein